MKKFIPALLITASIPLSVMASQNQADTSQPAKHPEHMPCLMNNGMMPPPPNKCMGPHAKGLQNLTPEQQAKIRETMQTQDKKRRDITKKYLDKLPEAEKKAMQDELTQNREDTHKAIRAILTPEQQKNLDQQKAKQEECMKEWKEFQEWKASKAKQ